MIEQRPAIGRDTVVIGMCQEPDGLGVKAQSTGAAGAVMNPLFCALVEWNEHWQPFPRIAAYIPSLDDGTWRIAGDTMMMRYRMRPGYRWHDGTPVTADDVRFGWEFCLDPRVPATNSWIEHKVDDIHVLSEYEFEVRFRERLPHADVFFGTAYGTVFMPRRAYEPHLKANVRLSAMPYRDAPLGNGPYRFDGWDRGSELRLVRVDDFVEGQPLLKHVVFRFYPDAGALRAAQIAGEVDATELSNFSLEDMAEIERQAGEAVATHYSPAIEWEHIDINLDRPKLSDRRVRHAILAAIDRERIVDREFGCRVNVAHTWLGEKYYAFHSGVRRHLYDPNLAGRLLDEAGWTKDGGEIRTNAAGERLSLVLLTTPGSGTRRRIGQAITDDLRRSGIELTVEELPPSVLVSERLRRRDFDLVMLSWVMSPTAPGFGLWHSSQIPADSNNHTGQNFCGWKNPDNDRLISEILREMDTGRRIDLFREQQELFAEELPSLPLYFRIHLQTAKRGLTGIKPVGLSGTWLAWNAHHWQWR